MHNFYMEEQRRDVMRSSGDPASNSNFVREIISVCFALSASVKPFHSVLKFKISVILIALTKHRFEAA